MLILRSIAAWEVAALWLKTKKLPTKPGASVHPGSRVGLIGSFALMRPSLDANLVTLNGPEN